MQGVQDGFGVASELGEVWQASLCCGVVLEASSAVRDLFGGFICCEGSFWRLPLL